MYQSKLRFLMAAKKINSIKELTDLAGLSRPPLDKLYKEQKLETLTLETLAKVCDVFDCKLSDLIEYIPDKPTENPTAD